MTVYPKKAVAIGDLKNAALYFDELIPVNLGAELMVGGGEWDFFEAHGARQLLPHDLAGDQRFLKRLGELNEKTFRVLQKEGIRRFRLKPEICDVTSEEYESIEKVAAQAYFDFMGDFALGDWPLAGKGLPTTAGLKAYAEQGGCPLLTLSQVPIIDASGSPWEQIFDFRKDSIAREKLRRLRLFAFENYSGKPREYVEDDLFRRISEYEAVAKQWGLETFQGAMALVLKSKLAAGALAGSFLSAVYGQPAVAVLAAGIGAATEIGHFCLELRRRKVAFQALVRENPVSYVIYGEQKLCKKDR
jgi:hypothetical protein